MKYIVLVFMLFIQRDVMAAKAEFTGIVLLQPDFVFTQKKIDVNEMSTYIRSIQTSISESVSKIEVMPGSGHIVIAVRDNGESKMWLDFDPAIMERIQASFAEAIKGVDPFGVSSGTIIFSISTAINDAPPHEGMPFPAEWRNAIKDQEESMEIERLIEYIWP